MIGLGVLIVLGTALVIGVVVKRIVESTHTPVGAASTTPPRPSAVPGDAPFNTILPGGAGAKIAGVTAADGIVAVWLRDDKGGRIDFIDPRSGALVGSAAAP